MPGIPETIHELEFDQDGHVVHPEQVDALLAAAADASDVLVLSHGWNNDMAEARDLYARLRAHLAAQAAAVPGVGGRAIVIAGVLWPSKKFAEKDLVPGGAASASSAAADGVLCEQIATLEAAAGPDGDPADFARLRELAPELEDVDDDARGEFASRVVKYLPRDGGGEDGDVAVPAVLRTARVGGLPLLEALGRPVVAPPPDDALGGATSIDEDAPPPASSGGAAGLGDLFSGVKAGAMNLLNVTTYYKMKDRAGTVGRVGLSPVLQRLRALPNAPRVHLAGHSFGARVVSAAALGGDGAPPLPVASITLLQGAFSHYGFASQYNGGTADGFFRRVVAEARCAGPLMITHTRNDKAVGIAYAVASRIMRQQGAALGDEHDKYGGMGSNGAQDTPEAVRETLHAPGVPYALAAGKVYNLKADPFVSGHSDVANDATAYAILSAIATS